MPHEIVKLALRAAAKRMRKDMTDAERRLWAQLRANRLMGLGFRRQMPIGAYIADFACPEHRLVVEVDGTHHAELGKCAGDVRRTRAIGNTGWTVIRFWNHEMMTELDAVCEHILAVIRKNSVMSDRPPLSASRTSPPQGGRVETP